MNACELEVGQLVKIVRLDKKKWNGPAFYVTEIGEINGLKRWGPRVEGIIEEPNDYPLSKGIPIIAHVCDLELVEPSSS